MGMDAQKTKMGSQLVNQREPNEELGCQRLLTKLFTVHIWGLQGLQDQSSMSTTFAMDSTWIWALRHISQKAIHLSQLKVSHKATVTAHWAKESDVHTTKHAPSVQKFNKDDHIAM